MNQNEHKDIGKIYRQRFADHESQPYESSWEHIVARLPKDGPVPWYALKNDWSKYRFILGLITGILISCDVFLYLNTGNKQSDASDIIQSGNSLFSPRRIAGDKDSYNSVKEISSSMAESDHILFQNNTDNTVSYKESGKSSGSITFNIFTHKDRKARTSKSRLPKNSESQEEMLSELNVKPTIPYKSFSMHPSGKISTLETMHENSLLQKSGAVEKSTFSHNKIYITYKAQPSDRKGIQSPESTDDHKTSANSASSSHKNLQIISATEKTSAQEMTGLQKNGKAAINQTDRAIMPSFLKMRIRKVGKVIHLRM
jgi:hypothetical protein